MGILSIVLGRIKKAANIFNFFFPRDCSRMMLNLPLSNHIENPEVVITSDGKRFEVPHVAIGWYIEEIILLSGLH